jgi:hypothetical protein
MNCPYTYTRLRVVLFIDVHDQSIEYKIRRHGIQRFLIQLDTRRVICSVLTHLEVLNSREFLLLAGVILVDIGKFHLMYFISASPFTLPNRKTDLRSWKG